MQLDVNIIRVFLALIMLSIASYTDIKKREIDDKIWMIFGGLSVVMIFFTPDIFHSLTSIGISLIVAPIALLVWRMGFFGGADAFALIVLASLTPEITFSSSQINPFTTLIDTIFLSVIPILVNVVRNTFALLRHDDIFQGFENETSQSKMLAMIIGHRSKKPRFSFPIEKKIGNSRKLDFTLKNADNAEFCTSSDTWVTPGMPYMIYILGGFIIQLAYGDILFHMLGMS